MAIRTPTGEPSHDHRGGSDRLRSVAGRPGGPPKAQARLGKADQHLRTAARLLGTDNEVAYGSLYDAARKAITAHMLANGVPPPGRAGAHEAVGIYAVERIPDASGSMGEFQRIRRRRNKSEYDLFFGVQDVTADLRHAERIVDAVRADL